MDLKHIIPQQRRRVYGPSLDIQYSVDRTNVPRVGPTPTFTRASSGTFVNENRRIVGKTTSTTSLNPASVRVGGVAVFAVPSGSVVGWLNDSVVSVMVDSDGNDQVDAQAHVTGTLLHKTDTAITLLVTSKAGTATVSSWFVSYRGQRITHDPVTGRCLGTLIEESKTNLLLRSDNFGTTWQAVQLNTTGTPPYLNVATAPDGTTTADKLIANAVLGTHQFRQSVTLVSGTVYSLTCYFKAAEQQFSSISAFGVANGNVDWVSLFNISSSPAAGTFNGFTSTSVTSSGNGWVRCTVVFTATASGSLEIRLGGASAASGINPHIYLGNGTSGILLWGAQFEAGLNATSYIPTTAVAAARAQDLHTITGANFLYMYNQNSGTVFCSHEISSFRSGGNGVYGFQAPNRAAAGITAVRNISTLLVTGVYSSPPNFDTQASFASSVAASGQTKSAFAFRTDDFANSVNGSISTDSSGTLNPIMDRFVIGATGNTAGPQVGNNIFSAIRLYRDRLPNAELQTLTTTATETIVYNGVPILYNGTELIETT
jgi:hypothetical protein